MIAKIAILFAVIAVACGAPQVATVALGHTPAGTAPLAVAPAVVHAAPAVTYAAAPAPVAYAAAAPVAYGAPVAVPAPVAYNSGVRIEQTFEPVEQHGYRIAY